MENFDDDAELDKRNKRMKRNRESAALSRRKKQNYVTDLENLVKAQSEYIHELESDLKMYENHFQSISNLTSR